MVPRITNPKNLSPELKLPFSGGGGVVGNNQFPTFDAELKSAKIPKSNYGGGGGGGEGGSGDQLSKVNFKISKSSLSWNFHFWGGGWQPISVLKILQVFVMILPLHWVGLAINKWFPYTSVRGTTKKSVKLVPTTVIKSFAEVICCALTIEILGFLSTISLKKKKRNWKCRAGCVARKK